ncbi:MAG: hypothetical protein L0Z48_07310 [candidate division Zixibacteria bacterium]|nr:hypothetical protein [candidate division Zixibacteria bacterium]
MLLNRGDFAAFAAGGTGRQGRPQGTDFFVYQEASATELYKHFPFFVMLKNSIKTGKKATAAGFTIY